MFCGARVVLEVGIRRDKRLLEQHRASVQQSVREYKDTTDFERAHAILARYETESALPYDALRRQRQKQLWDKRQCEARRQAAKRAITASSSGSGRSLWDTLVGALVGGNEDGPMCALVCRQCAQHNGFVGVQLYPNRRLFCCFGPLFRNHSRSSAQANKQASGARLVARSTLWGKCSRHSKISSRRSVLPRNQPRKAAGAAREKRLLLFLLKASQPMSSNALQTTAPTTTKKTKMMMTSTKQPPRPQSKRKRVDHQKKLRPFKREKVFACDGVVVRLLPAPLEKKKEKEKETK